MALVPAGTPVIVELNELVDAIVAVPLITVHVPVPTTGFVAAIIKLPLPHCEISGPALEVTDELLNTTMLLELQIPFVTVQRKIALELIGIPVTVVVALVGVVIVAVPDMRVQIPEPAVGAVAAIIKFPPQRLWSDPAMAVAELTITVVDELTV